MENRDFQSVAVLAAARDEADRVGATVTALREALPGATVWVADDGSTDGTAAVARAAGATVVRQDRPLGKGGNVTAAAEAILAEPVPPETVLLCDADLGETAGELVRLVEAVRDDECDLAVASFARKVGGGFGFAVGFSAWAIRKRSGAEPVAPISGQRAMPAAVLRAVLPLASGYGMETGMTIDAVRAGYRLGEFELDLAHRATGRSLNGFLHRFRQLLDFIRVWWARRGGRGPDGRKPAAGEAGR